MVIFLIYGIMAYVVHWGWTRVIKPATRGTVSDYDPIEVYNETNPNSLRNVNKRIRAELAAERQAKECQKNQNK